MTIQQTERAREILMDDVFVKHMVERLRKIIWSVTGCSDSLAELAAGEVADYIERQTIPPPSEEVVEAVARAIERADNETGYEYDHLHIECSDWGIHLARAAIAAMPSIPQESDAEVTEAKGTMSVPMYDRCDTYVAGQYVFNYLRTFLAAAGIDASRCKLVVELPDRDTQRQLVSAVQRDSKGPPRSAGRIGNHSGLWQGVEYEFSVKGWNDTAMTSARDREQPK